MERIHTHYDNLKVARNAPPEVIRAAYKSLSQKYHPDRNPGSTDAIRIIQIINAAYEVLSDPVKRSTHDAWIAKEEAGQEIRKANAAHAGKSHQAGAHAPHYIYKHAKHARQRSEAFQALQKFEAAVDNFFRTLFRKVRHAPHAENGRHH
jgi:DnaJ-class molecular chaperone